MKKTASVILAIALIFTLFSFTGCKDTGGETGGLTIISTIYPQYDFVKEIVGNKATSKMLITPGAESHTYEPTPQDIIAINKADVFIYVGGDSDAWVSDILKSIDNKNLKIITLMDCVDLVPENEDVAGTNESESESGEEEETEYDEHVWTSPKNAIKIVNKITEALKKLDTSNAETFQANADAYTAKLNKLDTDIRKVISDANGTADLKVETSKNTIVVADRFPLRYFVDSFNLNYCAAFPGCSTETEVSAKVLAALIDKVKQLKIKYVLYIEFSNENIADTVCESTGAKKKLFYSCHNVTKTDYEKGVSYLEFQERNLETLKEILV